jgi:tetratricopeptide (TPR) repeat protein/predicted aspartyl protease
VQAATRKLGSPGRCPRAVASLALSLAICPLFASAKCLLNKVIELPITMSGMRPTFTAKINGADARFTLDSGAFYSIISSATAAQFQLRLRPGPYGLRVKGVGGSTDTSLVTVNVFTLAGIPLKDVEFLVGGSEIGGDSIGLMGQNLLEKFDVEYDFARGVVRLFKADDCKHTLLAYWTTPEQALSMLDISHVTPSQPHTTGTAFINGAKITVVFDTGASNSVLTARAAARAGVKPDTAGVVEAGYSSGIGRSKVKTYIAPFSSFKIGDGEEIKNARLRIADMDLDEGDMLLGADFFLSHHVYVANSQHRLYLTYNGGPVFNLSRTVPADVAADADAADAHPTDEPADAAAHPTDQPADAAAYARRGAAFLGRRDFEHAIADFTRASEMNPNEAEYWYLCGMAHWQNQQPIPALSDFDRTLELNSNYLAARISRAQMRLGHKDIADAVADLDAADRIAAKQDDARFMLAHLYQQADLPAQGVAELDLWIANHPDDSKMIDALHGRCRLRAVQGEELAKALNDCNAAYRQSDKSNPVNASILESRGLVRLRLGDYDKAIADYDESLKLAPKNAAAMYGRGVAKIRKQKTADGEADLTRASALSSTVADEFKRHGISP